MVEVEVTNPPASPVRPEVYAWADHGTASSRPGGPSAGSSGPGERAVEMRLIGDPEDAELEVSAPPTIYQ